MESETGGSKPLFLEGRLREQRERLAGMTPDERKYRRQWLIDQQLAPDEPRRVPELELELRNPIRRMYAKPLDAIFDSLKPVLGEAKASGLRFYVPKYLMGIAFVYAAFYYFKYNQNDWTRKGGWMVMTNRSKVVPGDESYPKVSDRNHPWDYADRGFKNRNVFLD